MTLSIFIMSNAGFVIKSDLLFAKYRLCFRSGLEGQPQELGKNSLVENSQYNSNAIRHFKHVCAD